MAKPVLIYWDTCAWIGLLNGESDKKRELGIVYGNARSGKCEIWTSTLSMIECRYVQSEKDQPRPLDDENNKIISRMFRQPFVKPIPMSVDIVEDARGIWRNTKDMGSYQDAIHLSSALRWNVGTMHTYDRIDLLNQTEKFNCQNGQPLTICYPDNTTDGPLFGQTKQN